MKYTVIVGRPDYVSDHQISDTYMTTVEADDPKQAGLLAREECGAEDYPAHLGPEWHAKVEDYVVVACIEGEHVDVYPHGD